MVVEIRIVHIIGMLQRSQSIHVFHFFFVLIDITVLRTRLLIQAMVALSVNGTDRIAHICLIVDLWPILGIV